MSFDVDADSYDRFMGRFSGPLAGEFAALLDVRVGEQALDVGCGPGALTAVLVQRLGAAAVAAVDPSEQFVATARARFPAADVRLAGAEALPFPDCSYDLVVAQLVVHFMSDPVAGLREMARVARPGGRVAATVWDHAGGSGPLGLFWRAVNDLDQDARDESGLAGARQGHLTELFDQAGLGDVQPGVLTVRVGFTSFSDWWEPFTLGVGPAGAHVAHLDSGRREALRAECAKRLPPGPFEITAAAWTAVGRA